ncbi:hypothetical protein [Arthrobacter globiformis]|uniref:hypothetical protein n=1 Tax=Arthrobacter globiformis TaxID=1665 RepID=UPI002790BA9B|nr:hypothetical protein [Arthrobacter globiformis]MDQ0616024.1 hypothetical protein [Arthrobacter globiformis]
MSAVDITASHHRLKVVVHIDANMERACIEVRGTLTPANIRALYVVARRARTLLPGKEIILDLSMARAAMDTITALHDPAQLTQLSGEGTSEKPCRLSILDPRPGIHAHPSFTHGRGDHKHPDGKHSDKASRTQERNAEPSTARSRTAGSNDAQATAMEPGTAQPSHAEPRVAARRRARDKEPA